MKKILVITFFIVLNLKNSSAECSLFTTQTSQNLNVTNLYAEYPQWTFPRYDKEVTQVMLLESPTAGEKILSVSISVRGGKALTHTYAPSQWTMRVDEGQIVLRAHNYNTVLSGFIQVAQSSEKDTFLTLHLFEGENFYGPAKIGEIPVQNLKVSNEIEYENGHLVQRQF